MSEKYCDQFQYNTIRAEIWKIAADKALTKEELVSDLLAIVGHFFKISRANYFEITDDGNDVECKVQWCSPGTKSYVGQKSSFSFCKDILKISTGAPLNESILALPPDTRQQAREYLNKHGVKSLLSMAIERDPFSFFSFSDDRSERQWTEADISLVGEMIRIVSMRMDQLWTEQ